MKTPIPSFDCIYLSSYWNSMISHAVFCSVYTVCLVLIGRLPIVSAFQLNNIISINILETIGMERPSEEDIEGMWWLFYWL